MESNNDTGMPKMDSRIRIKQEPCLLERASPETNADANIREPGNFASVFILQPDASIQEDHEGNTKLRVKEEPLCTEATSTEVECQSETTRDSDVYIKSESSSVASDFMVQPGSNIYRDYHEIDPKVQIKEELSEWKSSSENFEFKNVNVHFGTEDNGSEGEEFILPESTRLDTEVLGSFESGVTITNIDQSCLRLKESTSSCNGKARINAKHEGDIRETFIDEEKPYRCKFCGKCFRLASELETHILTHEGRRRYKCNVCDKCFTQTIFYPPGCHVQLHTLEKWCTGMSCMNN